MTTQKLRLGNEASLFAALGDSVRLAMVRRLCAEGPLATVQLKRATQLSRQAVTKHLMLLENAKIVQSQRVGRDRLWQMETKRLRDVREYLDQISAEWDTTLERLRKFVEDDRE